MLPEFVRIELGEACIGPDADDTQRDSDEGQARICRLYGTIDLARKPTTFENWDAYTAAAGLRYRPSDMGWGRGQRPVINVSWNDVQGYLAWLTGQLGVQCRLPAEIEWEYAARAGTRSPFWWGDTADPRYANFSTKRASDLVGQFKPIRRTTLVASYPPNPWGLFDMNGNVWQWCQDPWRDLGSVPPIELPERRVLRGGAWDSDPHMIRNSYRTHLPSWVRMNNVGFRVVKEL